MQTFSNMQRNLTYQNFISYILWTLFFTGYICLSSIYTLLPPMVGVLLVLFDKALKKNNSLLLFFIVISIIILETQKGFLAFSLLVFFLLAHKYIIPKINQDINAHKVRNFLYVFIAYIGYIAFTNLISQIFILENLHINILYITFYIIVEYFIVSIFL